MRIIRRRRRASGVPRLRQRRITLKVDVVQAKELLPTDNASLKISAGIAYGRQTKRTHRVKNTVNPQWNTALEFRMRRDSPVIYVGIFDRHKRYSIYMGELRLSLLDIFTENETGQIRTKVPPKWYKLRSSRSQNAFISGSIKIGFEVRSKSKDIAKDLKSWASSVSVFEKPIVINEQEYYTDSETDVESLLESVPLLHSSNTSAPSSLDQKDDDLDQLPNFSSLNLPTGCSTNSSATSNDSCSEVSDTSQISRITSALSRRPHQRKEKVKISGVVFLEIQSASGLPPLKGFTKARFDMDPFVVISFGKKTFRSSWRKHTLTPVFNDNLAFEVLNLEEDYKIVFNILDKDHISFHDKVAVGSINLKEVLHKREFVDYDLPLKLFKDMDYEPHLKFRIKFKPYADLKNDLWSVLISKFGDNTLDILQLDLFLEQFDDISDEMMDFYKLNDKSMTDLLTIPEIIKVIEKENIQLKRCPFCGKRKTSDMVTHAAICLANGDKLKTFATAGLASKRWYSKVLIKFAYGKYAFGKNNANILVQDRITGFIMEEKMALYIRLGIRLLYKGRKRPDSSKRIKNLLRNLSMKQGARFDSPLSVKDIDSFIKFYNLDLSECLTTDFTTFNEFFYRKLKPGSRAPESEDPQIIVSPADSRCTAFSEVSSATQIWIKSRAFTINKLVSNEAYSRSFEDCSIAIFRLAPQDYHRFHSPVEGIVGKAIFIEGEYYTVNPMAVRSDLDVFGENIRVVLPIETKQFGRVLVVAVGAMMVGSIILTAQEGDYVKRADELGYFKFGGSTVITLFQKGSMQFDGDLVSNSLECIESLVRVGMSVGHAPKVQEFKRATRSLDENTQETMLKVMRTITGGDSSKTWEILNMDIDSDDEIITEDEV